MDSLINHNHGLLYVIHFGIIPILLWGGTRVLAGRALNLSFVNTFIIAYFILIYVGAVDVINAGVGGASFLLAVWSVPFLFMIGSAYVFVAVEYSPSKAGRKRSLTEVSESDLLAASNAWVFSLIMCMVPLVYMLDKGFSNVALFFIISNQGNFVDTLHLRVSGMESSISSVLTYVYSYSYLLFFPGYVSVLASLRGRKLVSRRHFVTVFMFAAFFSVLTSEKAGLAFITLAAALAFYLSKPTTVLDTKTKIRYAIFGLVAILIPGVLYPLLYGFDGAGDFFTILFDNVWRRVSFVPGWAAALYFDAFPDTFPFVGPKSNRLLSLIFADGETLTPASMINDWYLGNWLKGGLVNAGFFASMYADWGALGVVFSSMFIGMIIAGLQIYYDRYSDLVSNGFRAATLIAVTQLMITNVYSVSLGRGMLSLPILFWIYRFVSNTIVRERGNPAIKPLTRVTG